jgi:RNA recognition motif-containing protein
VVETTEAAKDGDDAALRNEKRKARMEEKRAQRQTAGIPSETKLFVYGLGSDATKEGLLELFKDYKPTEAKIAQRQLPAWLRKKKAQLAQVPGGRGFGFVTFANKEDQQAALKALDGASYGKRELSVKVAMDLPSTTDSDGNATPDGTVPDGNKAEKQESSPAETPTAK